MRERKREQTRQAISDAATRLFEEHGFEEVTLADVASRADVSVKTVVNYFGAKEDLFFDAEPQVLHTLTAAVRNRGDQSATSALRPLVSNSPILAGPCAWAQVDDGMWDAMAKFARCEANSPTLTGRRAVILQSWLDPLAEVSESESWAALAVGVLVLRHQIVAEGLLRGRHPRTVRRRLLRTVGQAMDVLETGFGDMTGG